MFSCRNSGTHLAKTQLLALFEVPWLYAMAEEPLPKKQKLTHQWLTDQLNDFDEGVKQSVLNHLANFSEDDLKEAPVASLVEILPAELTLVAKQRVASRLEKGIRKTFQPPQHALGFNIINMFVSLPFQVWLFRSSLVLRYVCLSRSFVCFWRLLVSCFVGLLSLHCSGPWISR